MTAHMHKIHRLRQTLTGAQILNYTNGKHPNKLFDSNDSTTSTSNKDIYTTQPYQVNLYT